MSVKSFAFAAMEGQVLRAHPSQYARSVAQTVVGIDVVNAGVGKGQLRVQLHVGGICQVCHEGEPVLITPAHHLIVLAGELHVLELGVELGAGRTHCHVGGVYGIGHALPRVSALVSSHGGEEKS